MKTKQKAAIRGVVNMLKSARIELN